MGVQVPERTDYKEMVAQGSNPANPPAGKMRMFVDTTGVMKWINSAGAVTAAPSDGTIFSQTADKDIVNTATETSLVGTGVGSLTAAANWWTVGKSVRMIGGGYMNSALVPGNVSLLMEVGGVEIATTGPSNFLSASLGDAIWTFDGTLTCRTIGASGTFFVAGTMTISTGIGTIITIPLLGGNGTVNTTATTLIDPRWKYATADGDNQITSQLFVFSVRTP